MTPKLMYIGIPVATDPVVQPLEGQRAVITSIRLCAASGKNGTYEIHHVPSGYTATGPDNALAYNTILNDKVTQEFLTHPMVVGEGESLWIRGDGVTFAIYGILL